MERLADMMRAVDQPTRGEASECFAQLDSVFGEGPRRGILVILPKYCLADLLAKPRRGTAQGEVV